jgi:hypothetical protein
MQEDRDLLLVAVFTALTIALWIFFDLVQTTRTTTISAPLQESVSQFSPNIDSKIFDTLESRQTFD